MSDVVSDSERDATAVRRAQIMAYLETRDTITNADVRALLGVSSATANRILAGMVQEGLLLRCRVKGHWGYRKG